MYELIHDAIEQGLVTWTAICAILILVYILNMMVIRISLVSKYALQAQSHVAAFLIFGAFAAFSFVGFYARMYVENYTSERSIAAASNTPFVYSPPLLLLVAVTVATTLSIFSSVYTLAAGRYSKTDYASFQLWFRRIFVQFAKMEMRFKSRNGIPEKDLALLLEYVENAIDTLEKTLPYEAEAYQTFIERSLLFHLNRIQIFFQQAVDQKTPEIILEIGKDIEAVSYKWIIAEGFFKSYATLAKLAGHD